LLSFLNFLAGGLDEDEEEEEKGLLKDGFEVCLEEDDELADCGFVEEEEEEVEEEEDDDV